MTEQQNPVIANPRTVKSYVIRGNRMTEGQEKAWQLHWPVFGLDETQGRQDWSQLFGNDHPLVLEIGFGMGTSLVEMAKASPELNFIGVEVHRPGVGSLMMRASDADLTNLRVFCCDANIVLAQCLTEASLRRVQLYFPDPWHKTRHQKRRIVQPEFVQRIRQVLEKDGVFHLATDWEHYARHMLKVLNAAPGFVNLSEQSTYCPKPDYRPDTKFEHRGLKLGHGVWDLLFRRSD